MLLAGVNTLFGLIGSGLFGRVMDRMGALKTQALTGLLIPIIPTAWIWVTAPWQVGVLEAYAGLVWAGYNLANFALLLELTPGSHRPQAVALYQTVVFASAVVGPLLGGWLADTFGFHVIFARERRGPAARHPALHLARGLADARAAQGAGRAVAGGGRLGEQAMILSNGRIYTLDGQRPRRRHALVVRAGRIAFAGRRRDLNAPVGEREIDLGGRAVLPGLVDAHGHLMYLARLRLTLDVAGLTSETACAERVAARAATLPAGAWIAGRGWDQNRWPGASFPTRASLDRAAPGHPIALVRVDGHAIWASTRSAAARRASIGTHRIRREGGSSATLGGEPTGVLIDTAQELIRRVEPRPGPVHLEEAVKAAMADCLAVGLTGVHEMGADLDALAAYRRLEAAGAFPFRNHVALRGADAAAWQAALDEGPARRSRRAGCAWPP